MKVHCSSLYCRELNRIVESRGESVVQGDFVIRFQSAASNPQLQAVEQCAYNVCKRVIAPVRVLVQVYPSRLRPDDCWTESLRVAHLLLHCPTDKLDLQPLWELQC